MLTLAFRLHLNTHGDFGHGKGCRSSQLLAHKCAIVHKFGLNVGQTAAAQPLHAIRRSAGLLVHDQWPAHLVVAGGSDLDGVVSTGRWSLLAGICWLGNFRWGSVWAGPMRRKPKGM